MNRVLWGIAVLSVSCMSFGTAFAQGRSICSCDARTDHCIRIAPDGKRMELVHRNFCVSKHQTSFRYRFNQEKCEMYFPGGIIPPVDVTCDQVVRSIITDTAQKQ